jgi:serine acetyltransferase
MIRRKDTAHSEASIFCDWNVNAGRGGIQRLLLLYRLCQHLRTRGGLVALFGRFAGRFYTLVAHVVFGIDLPVQTQVGPRLAIHHGVGLVVNARSIVGADVTLRHNTTLGGRYDRTDCPTLEGGVDVGPHSVILGAIVIGAGARIGAGSVVLSDVPPGTTVAGNPAHLISGGVPDGREHASVVIQGGDAQ